MLEGSKVDARGASGYAGVFVAGAPAVGEFNCRDCGYGVIVQRVLPLCPMCRGSVWEQSVWRPFSRLSAGETLQYLRARRGAGSRARRRSRTRRRSRAARASRCRSGSGPGGSPGAAGRGRAAGRGGSGSGARSRTDRSARRRPPRRPRTPARWARAGPPPNCTGRTGRAILPGGVVTMVAGAEQDVLAGASGVPLDALAALAGAVAAAAQRPALAGALDELADAARTVSGAEVALLRVLRAGSGRFETAAVAGPAALAAEREGTSLPAADVPEETVDDVADAPEEVRRAAARANARSLLLIPVRTDGPAATLELYRAGGPFTASERLGVELAAGYAALVLRAFAGGVRNAGETL